MLTTGILVLNCFIGCTARKLKFMAKLEDCHNSTFAEEIEKTFDNSRANNGFFTKETTNQLTSKGYCGIF